MDDRPDFSYPIDNHMADEPQVEQPAAATELPPSPEAAKGIEAALERPEATEAILDKVGEDAIVEVKEYSGVADDSEFPEVSAQVKAQADAIEQQIRQKAAGAKAEISTIRSGAPEAPAAVEELPSEPVQAEVSPPKAKIAEAPPEASVPEATGEAKKEAAPMADFMSSLKEIVAEYKGANGEPSKLLQRKLAKLMADADPKKFTSDARLDQLAGMLGRLNAAMSGDKTAWQPANGTSFDQDLAAWEAGQPQAQVAEAPKAAEAAVATPEAPSKKPVPAVVEAATVLEAPPTDERAREASTKNLESAISSGNEVEATAALDAVEKTYNETIASRQGELQALYEKQKTAPTPIDAARIQSLETANELDRKTLEQRRKQLELIRLQKELKTVDAEAAAAQAALGAAPPERKQELQAKLGEVQARQADLKGRIAAGEAAIAQLAEVIKKMSDLKDAADSQLEDLEEAMEAPSASASSGGAESGGSLGGGEQVPVEQPKNEEGAIKTAAKTAAGILDDIAAPKA